MLLSEVVTTSAAVARQPGRRAKVDEIAGLLARVPGDEVPIAVAFLSGDLTQRQIGVGHRRPRPAPVADRSGIGPGRLWPDAQRVPFVEPRPPPAPRPHPVNIPNRAPHRIHVHHQFVYRSPSPLPLRIHLRDVPRCAAHVPADALF